MSEEKKSSYGKINHFTDIEAWKLARNLRMEIYEIIKELPAEERFDFDFRFSDEKGRCIWHS